MMSIRFAAKRGCVRPGMAAFLFRQSSRAMGSRRPIFVGLFGLMSNGCCRPAMGMEAAGRCVLTRRSAVVAKGGCVALRSSVALRFRGGVLAPHLATIAAAWQPPAAKEGQGDCDFPLGPPWILLYPLKRRRSDMGLEAAERCVLAQRSAVVANGWDVALRSCAAPLPRKNTYRPGDFVAWAVCSGGGAPPPQSMLYSSSRFSSTGTMTFTRQ